MRNVQVAPTRMVEENGSIHFGTFRTPFRNANILDAPLYSISVPRFWKNFRLNENCFWTDGKISCLKAVRFEFGDVMKPWKMKTTDGKYE